MPISRELALKILEYLDQHPSFHFPFLVMNREYSEEDDDFVEIEPSEWETIREDDTYQTFELWENIQNLDTETLKLMSKGFIDKITTSSLEKHISTLARNYRNAWRQELWESKDSAEYGMSEFIEGKAEGYQDCLDLIKMYRI